MKIIDVHIHFSKHEGFTEIAREAGHENDAVHMREVFRENNIVMGIVMGAGVSENVPGICNPGLFDMFGGVPGSENYEWQDFISYCCGVDSESITPENTEASLEAFERHLQRKECVGIKMYPGYNYVYLDDSRHDPFYDLARSYDVPVVIHTGDTAGTRGRLKYSHPLTVDDVAMKFPETRFVVAHCGNPWIIDAIEVTAKNPNVNIDLSGLAEGYFTSAWYCEHFKGYLEHLRTWLTYLDNYEKVMYGSDWPLVNVKSYAEVIASVIPGEHMENVFYRNALNVFPKLRGLNKDL